VGGECGGPGGGALDPVTDEGTPVARWRGVGEFVVAQGWGVIWSRAGGGAADRLYTCRCCERKRRAEVRAS